MHIITDAIINILGAVIIYLSAVIVKYFKEKRQALIKKWEMNNIICTTILLRVYFMQ